MATSDGTPDGPGIPEGPGTPDDGGPSEPPGRGDVDPPLPPDAVLQRYGARALDPVTAVRLTDRPVPRPTAYVADRLLVPAALWNDEGTRARLSSVLEQQGVRPLADEESVAVAAELREAAGALDGVIDPDPGTVEVVQRPRRTPGPCCRRCAPRPSTPASPTCSPGSGWTTC
jgi:hypothetical protein